MCNIRFFAVKHFYFHVHFILIFILTFKIVGLNINLIPHHTLQLIFSRNGTAGDFCCFGYWKGTCAILTGPLHFEQSISDYIELLSSLQVILQQSTSRVHTYSSLGHRYDLDCDPVPISFYPDKVFQ